MMRITCKRNGRTVCASLSGELDQHCAAEARNKLNSLISDGEVKRLVFDMSGVSFMDSAGIGVLLGRYRIIAARNGSMNVCGANRSVERILRMAGVYKLCTGEVDDDEK